MKILLFTILGLVGLTAVGASIYIMKGPKTPPPQVVEADSTTPPSQPPPAPPPPPVPSPDVADQNPPPAQTSMTPPPPGPDNGQPQGPGGRGARMQQIYDQLGLTDAQKQQIAQIRQTVTDRQQRREAIRNVMTPEQQTQFDQLRAQLRNNRGGGNRQDGNTAPPPPTPPPAQGT